jgi:hypothetical protein
MAHARPFWTSTLQDLSNDTKSAQLKEIWPLQSRSKFSGVPEDSNFPLLGVWGSPSHLAQSGVATLKVLQDLVVSEKETNMQLSLELRKAH